MTMPLNDHPFLSAISMGTVEDVSAHLQSGMNPNSRYPTQEHNEGDLGYPIQVAVASNRADMVRTLVDCGARVDTMAWEDRKAFPELVATTARLPDFEASMLDDLNRAGLPTTRREVIAREAINQELKNAVEDGDIAAAKQYMRKGADLNQHDLAMGNLVHTAGENTEMVRFLVENGASTSALNGMGRSPLLHQCWQASLCHPELEEKEIATRTKVIKTLVDLGADYQMEDEQGKTPLEIVAGTAVEIPLRQAIAEKERVQLQAVTQEPSPAPPALVNAYRNLQSQRQEREQERGRARL